jgi:hypothetical protein
VTRRDLVRLLPLLGVYVVAALLLPDRPSDEGAYLELARRLADGFYAAGDEDALLDGDPSLPDLWFPPGLALALTPFVALDLPVEVVRLAGPLFLFGAAVCFFGLLRLRLDRRPALLGAYALGLYPPFFALLPGLHSETLALLAVTGGMLAAAWYLERGRPIALLAAAGALAALALTRAVFGWVLTVVAILLVSAYVLDPRPAVRRSLAVIFAALVLCVPWLAYTQSKTEQHFVWATSGPLSLYWMTSPFAGDHGDWRPAQAALRDPDLEEHRPFFRAIDGLPFAEQNTELVYESLETLYEEPGAYGGNVAANVGRLLADIPYTDGDAGARILLYALSNAILLGGVVAALVALARGGQRLPPEATLFVLLAVVGLAFHVLLAASPRMLAPLVPVGIWLPAVAFARQRSV